MEVPILYYRNPLKKKKFNLPWWLGWNHMKPRCCRRYNWPPSISCSNPNYGLFCFVSLCAKIVQWQDGVPPYILFSAGLSPLTNSFYTLRFGLINAFSLRFFLFSWTIFSLWVLLMRVHNHCYLNIIKVFKLTVC